MGEVGAALRESTLHSRPPSGCPPGVGIPGRVSTPGQLAGPVNIAVASRPTVAMSKTDRSLTAIYGLVDNPLHLGSVGRHLGSGRSRRRPGLSACIKNLVAPGRIGN